MLKIALAQTGLLQTTKNNKIVAKLDTPPYVSMSIVSLMSDHPGRIVRMAPSGCISCICYITRATSSESTLRCVFNAAVMLSDTPATALALSMERCILVGSSIPRDKRPIA